MNRARIATVAAAAALTLAVTGPGASLANAASWQLHWSSTSASTPAVIDWTSVSVDISARTWVHRKEPSVRSMQADLIDPQGHKQSFALSLVKGGTGQKGTWTRHVTLLPQSPAGLWRVGFRATSVKHQTVTRDNAASFTLTKTNHAPLSISPGEVVVTGQGAPVTVRAFWDRHVQDARVVLADPAGGKTVARLSLDAGGPDYGEWTVTANLPQEAKPGRWTATTSYSGGRGVWVTDRTAGFTVRQTPHLSIALSTHKARPYDRVTISGYLTGRRPDGSWGGLAGQPVRLLFKLYAPGETFQPFGKPVRVDARGYVKLTITVVNSGHFEFGYGGNGLYVPVTSSSEWLAVR